MAKLVTAPTGDDVADAAVVASPVELLALLTGGATFGGVPVRSVRIELADGRVQRLELPEVDTERPMSKLAGQMLDVLRRVGEWTNGAALAMLVDPSGDIEHHSGNFKRAVQELKANDLIESSKTSGYRAK